MTSRSSLLLFDPYSGGHHAEHIRHIAYAWKESRRPGRLVACVSAKLLGEHPDLEQIAFESDSSAVSFLQIKGAEKLDHVESMGFIRIGRIHRDLFRKAVDMHRPKWAHALYLDHLQFGLATSLRFSFPVSISGLLFRPEFHYGEHEKTPARFQDRFRRYRKRLVLKASLLNPHLRTVFTLDPTAVSSIGRLNSRVHVIAQPDPIEAGAIEEPRESVRKSFGIDPGRKMLVLFGILDARKGVLALLRALLSVSEDACRNVAIVMVGRVSTSEREAISELAATVAKRPLQLVIRDEFVPENRIQSLISAADLALVPYQRHVGSSGVLIRAAAAQTPVLAQDYGVVAFQARENRLGQTVDTTSPKEIARAIEAFLEDPSISFDAQSAKEFASQNSVEAYTSVLFNEIDAGLTLGPSMESYTTSPKQIA